MEIYNYSHETGEYISTSMADPNPLVKDEFLVPVDATTIKPPVPLTGRVNAFIGGAWKSIVDNRGESYWTPAGEPVVVSKIGEEIPADALFEEPDLRSLDEVKQDAISLVNQKHSEILCQLTGNASLEERDTWQAKALAVVAIQSGTATAIQQEMIETEASLTGETSEQLVQTIAEKYEAYQKLIGLSSGWRRKTVMTITAATNKVEVDQSLATSEEQQQKFVQQWLADTA